MTTTEQIDQIMELLGGMYRALVTVKERELPAHPALYAVMAEGAVAQIQEFQHQLDEISGYSLALERQADLWLRIAGPQITWPDTPVRVLVSCLDTLQTGITKIALSLAPRKPAGGERARFLDALRRACALQMIALQPGSVQIGLRLPILEELTTEYDSLLWQEAVSTAQRAVEEFVQVAAWLAAEDMLNIAEDQQAETLSRRLALETLQNLLSQASQEVESLEIAGRYRPVRQPVHLTAQSTTRLQEFSSAWLASLPAANVYAESNDIATISKTG